MKAICTSLLSLSFLVASVLALSVSASAGPVTLICKSIQTHPAPTPDVNLNNFRRLNVTYNRLAVSTPTGPRTIYAPTNVSLTKKFFAVNVPAGARGEGLTPGQCGLATGVISGIDIRTASPNPVIVFNGLEQYSMDATFVNQVARNNPIPVLPPCTSGVHQIEAQQFSPNEYSVSSSASITCIP